MNTKREQKEFLLEKVRELSAKSLTQREIATVMQCSAATVNRCIKTLRDRSRENISKYVEVTLVEEFDRIYTGLEQITKNCWARYETANTDKDRYMFLSLAKDTYQVKAALLDSNVVLEKAVKFVNGRGLTTQNGDPLIDTDAQQAHKNNVPTEP